MKRLSMALALTLVLSAGSLWAQDVPKVEVFAGGSVMNINDTGFKITPFGWTASVAGNMNKSFGIVGEVDGKYETVGGSKVKIHGFLGGVQLTHRVEKVSAFAQFKAGISHFSGGGDSDNNFQVGFGGGVDWNANKKVAIRLIQIDWLPLRAQDGAGGHEWVKNVSRASIGIVFKGQPK